MTEPRTFMGFPLLIASNDQLKMAVMNGRFLHREAGIAGYEYEGKIYIVEADKPAGIGRVNTQIIDDLELASFDAQWPDLKREVAYFWYGQSQLDPIGKLGECSKQNRLVDS